MTNIYFGQVIGAWPQQFTTYKTRHKNNWPEIIATLKACNIRSCSMYKKNGALFAYYEYSGNNFHTDLFKLRSDDKTRDWWETFKPMLQPKIKQMKIEWLTNMEMLFLMD